MEKPVIDDAKCTVCGTCVDVCPVRVFAKENDKIVVKEPESCIQCRACEANCPTQAIEVKE